MPGRECAGALIILLDTPPVGQHGASSLSFHMSLSLGVGWAGIHRVLTGVGARDEPEAAVLQRGILYCDPHAQHAAQRLRVQEGSILVRGD